MADKLYYKTVSPVLREILIELMKAKPLASFRLVGGTALSLYRGHRMSIDIDLFTDEIYDSIDFNAIGAYLKKSFDYIDYSEDDLIGMGKSYFVGKDRNNCIKLDIYYTDPFIDEIKVMDGIRLAGIEDIIAMKMDVIMRGGRKKDFWDIHEFMGDHTFKEMIALHEKRYPYSHNSKKLKKGFQDFTIADEDFDPVCLLGKNWELIKLDLIDFASGK